MIIDQQEGQPASYPAVGAGLSTQAQALDLGAIWQRIESWIAYRWGERTVTWMVQGPADFIPPLKPYTVDTAERWNAGAFESIILEPAPLGLILQTGVYRITATVGTTDDPPAAVIESVRRLAEYLADEADMGRVSNARTVNLGSSLQYTNERPVNWLPRAIHYSGAADLLRGYRRV